MCFSHKNHSTAAVQLTTFVNSFFEGTWTVVIIIEILCHRLWTIYEKDSGYIIKADRAYISSKHLNSFNISLVITILPKTDTYMDTKTCKYNALISTH